MVFFNYTTMQVSAKIVYYGPGLCGKTTNLQQIHSRTEAGSRGEMVSLETEADRTLFFDLLPLEVGTIGGMRVRLQLYTVPGQVFYNTTRKLVLKGVDGIVFVADSQVPALDANVESLGNLEKNLAELGITLDNVPMVLQFNKRDLRNIHSIDVLNQHLNPNELEVFEGAALHGIGVFETLKAISKKTLAAVHRRISGSAASQADESELASEVDSAVEARKLPSTGETLPPAISVPVKSEPAVQAAALPVVAATTMTADLFSQLAQEVDLEAEPIHTSMPTESASTAPGTLEHARDASSPLSPSKPKDSDPDTSEVKIEFAARGTAPEFRPKPVPSEPVRNSGKRKVVTKSPSDVERELEELRRQAFGGGAAKSSEPRRVINVQKKAKVKLPHSILNEAGRIQLALSFQTPNDGTYEAAEPIVVDLPTSSSTSLKRLELEIELKAEGEEMTDESEA